MIGNMMITFPAMKTRVFFRVVNDLKSKKVINELLNHKDVTNLSLVN